MKYGDPARTRTPNLLIRSQPARLRRLLECTAKWKRLDCFIEQKERNHDNGHVFNERQTGSVRRVQ